MLDKQATSVVNIINSISDGSFKIIDAEEIISKLGESEKASKLELAGIIRTLVDHELIKVKFSTLDEYCLAALPKARIVEEKVKANTSFSTKKSDIVVDTDDYLPMINGESSNMDISKLKKVMKKSAFYGSLVGGAVVGIVGIVIGLIIK